MHPHLGMTREHGDVTRLDLLEPVDVDLETGLLGVDLDDGEPAYDSSPRWMPAHCSADIAPVPESVSRSMYTSLLRSRNVFQPASDRAVSRSARVVIRRGSTILIL